jgi:hypothetical protein
METLVQSYAPAPACSPSPRSGEKGAFGQVDRPRRLYKGLSSTSADRQTTIHHSGRWLCTSEVIGVTRDSKFGEEGGLKPQVSWKARFTREIAAISFTTVNFQNSRVKRREVRRSRRKPKKWRKTVARSSPESKISCSPGVQAELARLLPILPARSCFGRRRGSHSGGGLLIQPDLFALIHFRFFCLC